MAQLKAYGIFVALATDCCRLTALGVTHANEQAQIDGHDQNKEVLCETTLALLNIWLGDHRREQVWRIAEAIFLAWFRSAYSLRNYRRITGCLTGHTTGESQGTPQQTPSSAHIFAQAQFADRCEFWSTATSDGQLSQPQATRSPKADATGWSVGTPPPTQHAGSWRPLTTSTGRVLAICCRALGPIEASLRPCLKPLSLM